MLIAFKNVLNIFPFHFIRKLVAVFNIENHFFYWKSSTNFRIFNDIRSIDEEKVQKLS